MPPLGGMPGPGDLAGHARMIEQMNQQKRALVNQQVQQQAGIQQKVQAMEKEEAARPDIANTPPPTIPTPDPIKGFASAASMFALIAAAFTHTPAVAAMDGMAAAINARNKNDMDAYEKGYQQWKENTDLAIKRETEHRAKVNQALQLMQTDAAAGEAMFKTINTEYGDEKSDMFALTRDWASVAEIGMARERLSLEMKRTQQEIEAQKPLMDAKMEYEAAMKSGDPDRIAKAKDNLAFITNPTSNANQMGSKDWQFKTLFADAKAHGQSDAEATKTALQGMASAKPEKFSEKSSNDVRADIKKQHPEWSDGQVDLAVKEQLAEAGKGGTLQSLKAAEVKNLMASGMPFDKANALASGEDPNPPLTPDAARFFTEQYLTTRQMPQLGLSGKGRTAAARLQILNMAPKIAAERGLNADDILSGQASFKADSGSLTAVARMSDMALSYENTALANIKIAEGLLDKGAGTSLGPVVNRWIQGGRQATGDPDVKALDGALRTAATEYAKVMSGSTGSQAATDSARNDANEMLSKVDSPAQIRAMIHSVMIPDMENRKSALAEQRNAIQGRLKSDTGGTGMAHQSAAGGAAPASGTGSFKYTGINQQGVTIHSNDGANWFTPDGKPYGAQ